jgi:hypothetical protein
MRLAIRKNILLHLQSSSNNRNSMHDDGAPLVLVHIISLCKPATLSYDISSFVEEHIDNDSIDKHVEVMTLMSC